VQQLRPQLCAMLCGTGRNSNDLELVLIGFHC
jgi:hypothetical protein